jgi:hypothetical protein
MNFNCKKCGKCCTAKGFLYVNLNDVVNISEFLKIKKDDFINNYLHKDNDDKYYLGGSDNSCHFFQKGCTIYDVRPYQCRSYPFWYYIVRSKEEWNKESRFCKGIKIPSDL